MPVRSNYTLRPPGPHRVRGEGLDNSALLYKDTSTYVNVEKDTGISLIQIPITHLNTFRLPVFR